ncbi:sulfatase-like hydrolase/transferase [candidate division KSB1 bacterium]|nr:sulfatase-like hydrolase/transferase [candidate division KSB1 bacterium]
MSLKQTRREFIRNISHISVGTLAAGTTISLLSSCGNKAKKRKPNIIYILADDLGYGDLGCYGQERIQTPNIDRLAAEGIRFTQHYAGSTVCAPSRCSLMTGLHTGHAAIRGNSRVDPMGQKPLPAEETTVADVLKKAGYATALIGKWGLGGPDTEGEPGKHGFDYFFGYLCQRHAHNYYPEFLFRNTERVPLSNVVDNDRTDGAGEATVKKEYAHDLIMDDALSYIEKNQKNPFFLYLSPTIPHANNEAGDHGMEVPTDAPYSEKDWRQQEKNFAAMVTRLDEGVGKIMKKLKQLGLDHDTIVLFTSDNGPHREGGHDPDFFDSNGKLRGIKRDLYEGGIRVPLIARWKGVIEPDQVSDHVSAFWDFLPTAAEIAGTSFPNNIDGISFLPTLLNKSQKKHDHFYWEFHEGESSHQAVRSAKWKGVRFSPKGKLELYDLSADVEEKNNVADQHPEIVQKLEKTLAEAHTESELWKLKQ